MTSLSLLVWISSRFRNGIYLLGDVREETDFKPNDIVLYNTTSEYMYVPISLFEISSDFLAPFWAINSASFRLGSRLKSLSNILLAISKRTPFFLIAFPHPEISTALWPSLCWHPFHMPEYQTRNAYCSRYINSHSVFIYSFIGSLSPIYSYVATHAPSNVYCFPGFDNGYCSRYHELIELRL